MKEPQNLEEFYQVARAFALSDPEGNGPGNTIGFGYTADTGFVTLSVWAGAGNTWVLKDGSLVPTFATQEFIDRVLNLLRRMYSEKLINQDFATMRGQQVMDFINAGRSGMYLGAITEITTRFEPIMTRKRRDNPNLTLGDVFTYSGIYTTPEGDRVAVGSEGFNNLWSFPKSSIRTEAILKEIIELFVKIDSPEGQNLTRWGVEGRTFRMNNGLPEIIRNESYTLDVQVYSHMGLSYQTNPLYTPGLIGAFEKGQDEYAVACIPYCLVNLAYPFISETAVAMGADLDNIVKDAQFKYIMERIDEAEYKAAVNQYMRAGGDRVVREYNDAYHQATRR